MAEAGLCRKLVVLEEAPLLAGPLMRVGAGVVCALAFPAKLGRWPLVWCPQLPDQGFCFVTSGVMRQSQAEVSARFVIFCVPMMVTAQRRALWTSAGSTTHLDYTHGRWGVGRWS